MFEYEFPRPSVATDVCIFTILRNELAVALIERNEPPYGWALPGGFLRPDENLEECARRETLEETGVSTDKLFEIGTFSDPNRDPRTWVLSVAYFTLMKAESIELVAGTDAAKAELYPVSSLPGVLAFDHQNILETALKALSVAVKENPIALELIEEPFTLSQLQAVYLALGMREHNPKGNFYRYANQALIKTGMIEEAGGWRAKGRQRPAKLYQTTGIKTQDTS